MVDAGHRAPHRALRAGATVFDLVYVPAETPLRRGGARPRPAGRERLGDAHRPGGDRVRALDRRRRDGGRDAGRGRARCSPTRRRGPDPMRLATILDGDDGFVVAVMRDGRVVGLGPAMGIGAGDRRERRDGLRRIRDWRRASRGALGRAAWRTAGGRDPWARGPGPRGDLHRRAQLSRVLASLATRSRTARWSTARRSAPWRPPGPSPDVGPVNHGQRRCRVRARDRDRRARASTCPPRPRRCTMSSATRASTTSRRVTHGWTATSGCSASRCRGSARWAPGS